MKYKAIIWDLDGTLLNTLEDLCKATNHALATFGLQERTIEEVRCFVGNGVRNLMKRAVPDGDNNPQFDAIFAEFRQWYVLHCQEHTAPYQGIPEVLKTLGQNGLKMAIVSNKLQAGVTELWKKWFQDTIDIAIGERTGVQRKPAPDMVHLAISELGVKPEECVYIGDSDVDIMTAQNSGIDCISVLWGFRNLDELQGLGQEVFVSTPLELLSYIQEE